MKPTVLLSTIVGVMVTTITVAQGATTMSQADKIKNAMSAAPHSVADKATVSDWPAKEGEKAPVLRQGSNGWTCFPDMPDTKGNDPMCLDEQWVAWADAWKNKKPFTATKIGFGYMLQENAPDSNTNPYATGPTPDNEWMDHGVPHLMILVPDAKSLETLTSSPDQGGPWVMWRNTPYAHIMAPMPLHKK